MVPYFKSLKDFIMCRNLYIRSSRYLVGPERSDIHARLRRHFKDSLPPDFCYLQNPHLEWYKRFRYPH